MIYVSRKGGKGGHSCRCRSFLHACDAVYAPHAVAECATTTESSQIANLRYVRTILMHPTPAPQGYSDSKSTSCTWAVLGFGSA